MKTVEYTIWQRDLHETELRIETKIAEMKMDLILKMAEIKMDVIKWVAGALIAQAALIATLVKLV